MADDAPLHIVVFPWLAFGHMIPFLELSKSLARRGHLVSFLTTPRNLRRLPAVPPHLSPLLRLVPLPFQHSPSLPAGAEATSDIPSDQTHHLKKSYDALDVHIASFLRSATPPPEWIVHDILPHWLPSLAATLNIPCVFFSTFPAWALGFHGSPEVLKSPSSGEDAEWLTSRPDWVPFPTAICYRRHEARQMAALYTDASSGVTDGFRIASTAEGCDLVAFRSSAEFEPQWLGLVGEIYKKPVVPVGLFPPTLQERDDDHTTSGTEILEWLNNQKAGSVVYAALGTEAPLTIEFMHELALGLELADLPCIWAMRKLPTCSDTDVLPVGFLDRIAARGKLQVLRGWVPQLKILSHQAVGGFLTHCGWNSLVEGLGVGLPLVLLPVVLDQGLNARAMVEKGVGVEVERSEDDGFFTREAVSRAVRAVMVEGEGEEIRRKARQMGNVLSDRDDHERCMAEFVKCLRNRRRKEEIMSTTAAEIARVTANQ